MKKLLFVLLAFCFIFISCDKKDDKKTASDNDKTGNAADAAKTIAKNAFIYAYPMIEMYAVLYAYNIDTKNKFL